MRPEELSRRSGRALAGAVPQQLTGQVQRWLGRRQDPHPAGVTLTGLRRRTPKDVAACARLIRVVHGESGYPVRLPEPPSAWLVDDVTDAWVVEQEGGIVGHVALTPVGLDAVTRSHWREMTGHDPSELVCVSRLFVRPRVRGQGIGAALLDVAAEEGRRRGLHPVLEVVSPSKGKIGLLDERGWRLLSMDAWRESPDRLRVHCYAAPTTR